MNKVIKKFQYGDKNCTLETGNIARQASASVLIRMEDTVLLATVVGKKEVTEGQDFFPLTVNYQERSYAAGKVPGGYFKREGRPTEKETLISRLIDRPLRPSFPDGFSNEIQIIVTLLSIDPNVPSDIPAIICSSAALAISGLPFNGPIAAARVGYSDGVYFLNPSSSQLHRSELDLVVAGNKNAVLMVESEADQLSESVMLGAVMFGHEQMQVAIREVQVFANEVGKTTWDFKVMPSDEALTAKISAIVESDLSAAYQICEKKERLERVNQLYHTLLEELGDNEAVQRNTSKVRDIFHRLEKKIVREKILSGDPRIDGRTTEEIRHIRTEVGLLPRTHGSALFTRGDTQALVVCTLGTERDAQIVDDLEGEFRDPFILHYNFPPYCVGEVGFMSGPKRREIGHGKLVKRALQRVVPSLEKFPYILRIVSEIMESNGSSSMASVCGTSMALMDAGVPIKSAVAGIAMGLIKDESKYAILSDILGDEDYLGDMDFKVAGTKSGITALQMDIKISDGITSEIIKSALDQAKHGRLKILRKMDESIEESRPDISQHAPRIITIKIHPDKIRDLIGKGGATIRELTESTNSTIDISDDGFVKIASVSGADGEEAKRRIEEITAEVEVGKHYQGKVVKIVDFGAFVEVLPGRQGLVHISQIASKHLESVRDYLSEGQQVRVKVLEIDRQGRIRLSMKEIDAI